MLLLLMPWRKCQSLNLRLNTGGEGGGQKLFGNFEVITFKKGASLRLISRLVHWIKMQKRRKDLIKTDEVNGKLSDKKRAIEGGTNFDENEQMRKVKISLLVSGQLGADDEVAML